MEIARRDQEATQWFKSVIASSDWPKPSEISLDEAELAWNIVRHVDADPAFKLQAPRALGRLVDAGQISGANYATRIDNILSKLTGTQRYGTQVDCVDGRFVPVPNEDESKVEEYRRAMGLLNLAEQARMMPTRC